MRTLEEIEAEINAIYHVLTNLKKERDELHLSTCPIKVGMIVKRTQEWRRSLIDTKYLVTELKPFGRVGLAMVRGRKQTKGGRFALRSVFVAPSDEVEVIHDNPNQ